MQQLHKFSCQELESLHLCPRQPLLSQRVSSLNFAAWPRSRLQPRKQSSQASWILTWKQLECCLWQLEALIPSLLVLRDFFGERRCRSDPGWGFGGQFSGPFGSCMWQRGVSKASVRRRHYRRRALLVQENNSRLHDVGSVRGLVCPGAQAGGRRDRSFFSVWMCAGCAAGWHFSDRRGVPTSNCP